MTAPFPHGAGTFNAQRPGDQPLTAIRTWHDARWSEGAACTVSGRNRSQFTIIRHRVVHTMAPRVWVDVDEIVTPSCHANDNALWCLNHGQRARHESPFDLRV